MIDKSFFESELFCECGNGRHVYGAGRIDLFRVLEKLDAYLADKNTDAARHHLDYWLREAQMLGDENGLLALENEMIGFCRKNGEREEALRYAETVAGKAMKAPFRGTNAEMTGLINAATAMTAFGEAAAALPLFEEAESVGTEQMMPGDGRLGGLYNNYAICLETLGRHRDALQYFEKALHVMEALPGKEGERAVTLLNMADTVAAEEPDPEKEHYAETEKRVETYVGMARELLYAPGVPHDAAFRYFCEKCAPVFGYYGWFAEEKQLTDWAAGKERAEQ